MQAPSLPSDLAIIVAGIASLASHWLRDDGLSSKMNALIAIVTLLITAGICIFLTTGFSGNLKDDTLLLIATAFALSANEFVALLGYIENTPSPLAPRVVTQATVATPSVRPTAQSWPPQSGDDHGH